MEEPYTHEHPRFTQWVTINDYLREPFVVIDVGVQGGEHVRWRHLGDMVHVYGFDAITEVINQLKASKPLPNRTYRALALGNEDGDREFYIPANTFSASFYSSGAESRENVGGIQAGTRTIPIRRLDTLMANGELPPADYIKIDSEGFEPEILRGAREYLARSAPVCVTVETGFAVSPVYPRSQFTEISDILTEHRMTLTELSYVRSPTQTYLDERAKRPWKTPDVMADSPDMQVGKPGTFDILFCRDLIQENIFPHQVSGAMAEPPSTDFLIKTMINYELHGLMDCAVAVARHFQPQLAERFDVEKAIALLLRRPRNSRYTADVANCMVMIGELRKRCADAETALNTTTLLAVRLLGRLATAPARLFNRYVVEALRPARKGQLPDADDEVMDYENFDRPLILKQSKSRSTAD